MPKSLVATTLAHARKDPAFAASFRSALVRVAAVRMDEDRFWGLVAKLGWPKDQDIAGVLFEEVGSDQELLAFLRTFQDTTDDVFLTVQENISKTPMGEVEGQDGLQSFGMEDAAAIVAMGKATCQKCMESIAAVNSAMTSEGFDESFSAVLSASATIGQYLQYRASYNALSEQARGLMEAFKAARGTLKSQLNEASSLLESAGGAIQAYLAALEAQNTSKIDSLRESGEVASALADFAAATSAMIRVAQSLQSLQGPLSSQISGML